MDAKTELETYLTAVFEPTDLVEVRCFHRVKGQGVRQFWKPAREVPSLLPMLGGLNTEGEFNVYVGGNPRLREAGSEADVALARCLFADWDDLLPPDAAARIAGAGLPPASLIVDSGHGVHAYWRLASPLTDMETWKAAQLKLIGIAGSDPKIKDPPRVMRLPGFINFADPEKDEGDANCSIIAQDLSLRYEFAQVVGDITLAEPPRGPSRPPSNTLDQFAALSRSTVQFCLAGAGEGERNSRLFSAACDMAGVGIPYHDAEAKLLSAATGCGLAEAEAKESIRSAYGQPRSPAVPKDEEIASAFQRLAPKTNAEVETAPAPARPAPNLRPQVANVVDTMNAEGESLRYYLPLPQIASAINEATGGWPRRASGMVFAIRETPDPIPTMRDVIWIGNAKELFAWFGHSCDTRWATGDAQHHQKKHKLNPPTKDELFAYLKENAAPLYRGVEVLPHVPPIPDTFYLPTKLPSVELDDPGTPLKELVRRFNPEQPMDRQLMLAALLTPGWGGPPGARPAFVFTSEHGRGVGKTITAQVIAEIWGGVVSIGAKEDWEVVRKRLLGNESLVKRVLLIDNIKGKFQGGDIEGMITAKELDGWKPYHGQASRPNTLTWFFTANTPSLSRDLADRSIIVKVGKQLHGQGFLRWAMEHIAMHRPAILAEAYAILAGGDRCSIDPENRDRWETWQDAVLTKFDDGNELAELAKTRRPDVDSDNDDAEEIAASVLTLVASAYSDHATRRIHMTYHQLYRRLLADDVIDKNFGPKQCNSWIRERCGQGALWFLRSHKPPTGGRGWIYTGDQVSQQCGEVNEIHSDEQVP